MRIYYFAWLLFLAPINLFAQLEEAQQILKEALAIPYWYQDSLAFLLLEEANAMLENEPVSLRKAEVMGFLSLLELEQGNPYKNLAVRSLEMIKSIKGDLDHPAARGGLFASSYEIEDYEVAINRTQKAFDLCRSDEGLKYHIGGFLMHQHEISTDVAPLEATLTELEKGLSQQPRSFQELYNLYILQGKVNLAAVKIDYGLVVEYGEVYYQELLDKMPNNIELPKNFCELMSFIYWQKEEYSESLDWANKGLKHFGKDTLDPELAMIYTQIGKVHADMGNAEDAIFNLKRAQEILLAEENIQTELLAGVNSWLSRGYSMEGKLNEALRVAEVTLDYAPNGRAYLDYGYQLFQQGETAKALEYIQQSFKYFVDDFSEPDIKKNPPLTSAVNNRIELALGLMLKGKVLTQYAQENSTFNWWGLAESSFRSALIFGSFEGKYTPGLKSAEVLGDNPMLIPIYDGLINTLMRQYLAEKTEASLRNYLSTSDQIRSGNLAQLLSPPTLPQAIVEESAVLEQKRAKLKQRLTLAEESVEKEALREQYFQLIAEIEAFEKNVKSNYPQADQFFFKTEFTDYTEIEKFLREDQAVLSYNYVTGEKLFISYTDQNGTQLNANFEAVELSDQISLFTKLLRTPLLIQKSKQKQFRTIGNQLYAALIAPFARQIADKSELIIIPNGTLEHLPFEALFNTSDAITTLDQLPYLIRSHSISYAPSATTLLQLQEKPTIKDNSLLAFAPVFAQQNSSNQATAGLMNNFAQDTITRSGLTADGFTPLPNSKKEVIGIYEVLGKKANQRLLLEQNATAENLRQASKKPLQFLHIATHGLANMTDPTLSALACYDNQEEALLYASDIQFFPLNVDLAILSSCDSGVGELALGEGILALNRTFLYAGANNVLFSLWKVSDRYSSKLMLAFYRQYQKTQNYGKALRLAKLELLSNPQTALPRYWSAFVLMGAGR